MIGKSGSIALVIWELDLTESKWLEMVSGMAATEDPVTSSSQRSFRDDLFARCIVSFKISQGRVRRALQGNGVTREAMRNDTRTIITNV